MVDLESRLERRVNLQYRDEDELLAKDALAALREKDEEIARLKAAFHSGEEIMRHYVPGYEGPRCETCGGPTKLPKFEALP